jgi:hypothetical protein
MVEEIGGSFLLATASAVNDTKYTHSFSDDTHEIQTICALVKYRSRETVGSWFCDLI